MTRAIPALILCLSNLCAQPAIPKKFDVASIRPTQGGPNSVSGITTRHGTVTGNNVTLKRCIIGAYNIGPRQVVGGPSWLDSDRFEIRAKVEQDVNDDAELMVMLQDLLAERFKLVLHKETGPEKALVLDIGKNGPKLEKAEPGESKTSTSSSNIVVTIDIRRATLDAFARILSRSADLPVVNKTGLEGIFNIKLQWTPDRMRPTGGTPTEFPSLVTAIQEQLGLRLHAEKTPLEVLVIDHAEKPTEN